MNDMMSQYKNLLMEITQLEFEIDRLDTLAKSPKIAHITGMPRSGQVTDGMDVVAKISDLRDMYYCKLGEFMEIANRIELMMSNSLNSEERVIIRFKYIDGLRNIEIADRIGYSESTVKRRIKKAMEKLGGESK